MEELKIVEEDYVEVADPSYSAELDGVAIVDNSDVDDNYKDDYVNESLDMTVIEEGFDPMAIQNGLQNSDNEGGAVGQKSRSASFSDKNDGGLYIGKSKEHDSGTFELSGFSVMSDKYNSDHMNVNAKYSSVEAAKMCVSGDRFMYIKNGEMVLSTIVEGTPEISDDETILQTYVDGEWRRL